MRTAHVERKTNDLRIREVDGAAGTGARTFPCGDVLHAGSRSPVSDEDYFCGLEDCVLGFAVAFLSNFLLNHTL